MKTLVLIGHPNPTQSNVHQFLLESLRCLAGSEYRMISDLQSFTQDELLAYDRIIFQVPIYWYSVPGFVKTFLDELLISNSTALAGKYFGIVATFGVQKEAFQAGGREKYTVSEMLRPFEMIANHFGMIYLAPFTVHQFDYMSQEEREMLLVEYQLYVSAQPEYTFIQKGEWLVSQLQQLPHDTEWLEQMILDNNDDLENLMAFIEEVD